MKIDLEKNLLGFAPFSAANAMASAILQGLDAEKVAALMPRARSDLAELVSYRSIADPRLSLGDECAGAARWIADALTRDEFAAGALEADIVCLPVLGFADLAGHEQFVVNEQFLTVLSNLSSLKIRAEYQTGSDIGHLDNVSLVPEPDTALMLLGGIGIIAFAARRKARSAG